MVPKLSIYRTVVHQAAPQAVAIATGLGRLYGRAIAGIGPRPNGAIRYGYPQIGMRDKYQGYAFPPQMFTGFNAARVAGGTAQLTTPAMPGGPTPFTASLSPLQQAMATVTAGQGG